MIINGTSGDDDLIGTAGGDLFKLRDGGNDIAHGRAGDDVFAMGGAFNTADRIIGSDGIDTVQLGGDYSAGVKFRARTMTDVENIVFSSGHDYVLRTHDATVAKDASLFVDASTLNGADMLSFNGGAESNGTFHVVGGAGDDVVTGGDLEDYYDLSLGGDDSVSGGRGNDIFYMGGALNAADRLNPGETGGDDFMILEGNTTIQCDPTTFWGFLRMTLQGAFDYDITLADNNNVGDQLQIEADAVTAGHSVLIDASAETHDRFQFYGGFGDDTFIGGAGEDHIRPHAGADTSIGGAGKDTFTYGVVSDSTGPAFDTILDFVAETGGVRQDMFIFSFEVDNHPVERDLNHGQLSGATFNSDLAAAVNSSRLDSHHVILFHPDEGDYADLTFLVVDWNGVAGYQANADLVICINVTGQLSDANFQGGAGPV